MPVLSSAMSSTAAKEQLFRTAELRDVTLEVRKRENENENEKEQQK